MKSLSTIVHKILGIVMLGIFLLAITPTVVFHNALANHHDENIEHHHTKTHEIAKASINCHWDNMVCEQVFLNNAALISIAVPFFCEAKPFDIYSSFFSRHHFFAELRGPPMVG